MRPRIKIFIIHYSLLNNKGFTLIELIMVILILGILTTSLVVKWPTGLDNEAAVLEFKHAVRHAQHIAITRQFTTAVAAWGISTSGNQYTVRRANSTEFADDPFRNRQLPGNTQITAIDSADVWFNGFGEPIDNTGTSLPDSRFNIGATQVTIFAETGYAE